MRCDETEFSGVRRLAWVLTAVLASWNTAVGQIDSETAAAVDAALGTNRRIQAVDKVWAEVESGRVDEAGRAAARETLKQIMWKGSAPSPLRQHALKKLLSDETPAGQRDNRSFMRLRLPTEAQWPVIELMCQEVRKRAADPGWTELAPALVRSYARKVPAPPDADRPEREALLALFPGKSIERVVFDVYLKPEGGEGAGVAAEIVEKQRQAAWELLGRLDGDGSARRDLLTGVDGDVASLKLLRQVASELRVVPVSGSELAWVTGLVESKDPATAGYLSQAREAVAKLSSEQATGLQLRHVEPVRWASLHRPAWLAASRDDLLSELRSRLEPRRKWRKSEGVGAGEMQSPELLSDWSDRLVFGDVLSILVIDEALKDPRLISSLFKQAEADRADSSTEYGGVIFAVDAVPMITAPGGSLKPKWDLGDPAGEGFVCRGYSARPAQRVNDRTFVAPEDMFQAEGAGGRVLAHYHFHAQTVNNADYAGPGFGDHEYATTHGRSCLVLTSVRTGVLNVDYYQRVAGGPLSPGVRPITPGNGIQIDLGEVVSSR